MQINNNFSAITRQIATRTPSAPSPGTGTTTAPSTVASQSTPVQKSASQRMQEYIGKSSKSTEDVRALTGSAVIQDLKSRAKSMGATQVQQNSKGIGDWLKQSSLYKFFTRSGDDSQDSGQVTKLGEAVNDATGTFSEISIKGGDDTLKLGDKGKEDLQKTTDALKGRDVKLEGDDTKVTSGDQANSALGITTSSIGLFKAGYDFKEAGSKWSECSELTSAARGIEEKAFASQKLATQLGDISIGRFNSIQTVQTNASQPPTIDDGQITLLVSSAQSTLNLSPADTDKLKEAITAKAKGTPPFTATHGDTLKEINGKLSRNAIDLMDQARIMKNDAKAGRREAALEMAKSLGTITEKGSNIASRIIEVADKSGVRHLANAAAVAGIASSVTSAVEMAAHIRSAVNASEVKDAMKSLRNPSKESFSKAADALNEKASKLEAKAAKLTKPKDADKAEALKKQAENLRTTATTLKNATPEQIEATKMQSLELDASAKQIQKRQGVGAKILNACIAGLKVAAGIAATVAVFAGAVALAATPVGWALGAAALVGGVAMGCYKAHQAYSRWKQNSELETMHNDVKDKISSALPDQGGPLTSARLLTLKQELTTYQQNPSHDATKVAQRQGQIDQMTHILSLKEDIDGDGLGVKDGLVKDVQVAEQTFNAKKSAFEQAKSEVERLSQGPVLTMPTGGVTPLDTARQKMSDAQSEMETAQNTLSGLQLDLSQKQSQLKEAETKFQADYPSPDELHALSKDIAVMRCRKDPNFAAAQIVENLKLTGTDKQLEAESLVEALGLDPAKFKQLAVANPNEAQKKLREFLNPS